MHFPGRARSNPPFSVLVLDENGPKTLSVLRCLGPIPGVKVHVAAHWSKPLRYSRYCDSYTVVPLQQNEEELLERIMAVARKRKVDIIFPTSKETVSFVIKHADKLKAASGLPPIPDSTTFRQADNKGALVQLLTEEGMYHPTTRFFQEEMIDPKQLAGFPFPALLKARVGIGGEGIYKVENAEDVARIVREKQLHLPEFILQEYMAKGHDISFSALCKDGEVLAHTAWMEVDCPEPSKKNFKSIVDLLQFYHDEQLKSDMDLLFKRLNWNGLANVNVRHDPRDGRNKVLEINPRIWDSLIGSLYAGVNFPFLACLAGLGIAFDPPAYGDEHFFMKSFLSPRKHRIGLGKPYELRRSKSIYILKDPVPAIVSTAGKMFGTEFMDDSVAEWRGAAS